MNSSVSENGTVQVCFPLGLVRFKLVIIVSGVSFMVICLPCFTSLKPENGQL